MGNFEQEWMDAAHKWWDEEMVPLDPIKLQDDVGLHWDKLSKDKKKELSITAGYAPLAAEQMSNTMWCWMGSLEKKYLKILE